MIKGEKLETIAKAREGTANIFGIFRAAGNL
jgi:hypothetical protein